MTYLYQQPSPKTAIDRTLRYSLLISSLLFTAWSQAEPVYSKVIEVTLGDYRYMPHDIQLVVDQPVVLQLVNVDAFTPHNFTLKDDSDGLDVDIDIPAGKSVKVNLMPLFAGSHTFYCSKQFLWMDSHREKGMQGTLTVVPRHQANTTLQQPAAQPVE
jgi:plastocyanin